MAEWTTFSDLIALPKEQHALGSGMAAILALESRLGEALYLDAQAVSVLGDDAGSSLHGLVNGFGRPMQCDILPSAAAAVAAAMGRASCGARSTAVVHGTGDDDLMPAVARGARHHVPMLIYALCGDLPGRGPGASGHELVHRLAETGAFVMFARDAQHALDLGIAARMIAERALIPGIIAVDAVETAWSPATVAFPAWEPLRELVGASSQVMDCASKAQIRIFGGKRRRVPRWFNLDAPAMRGLRQLGMDHAASELGRTLFFGDEWSQLADPVKRDMESVISRPVSGYSSYLLDDAEYALIAQGSAVVAAEAAADLMRSQQGLKVGVLGLVSLRPLPLSGIRKILNRVKAVTVIERGSQSLSASLPLAREIRMALPDHALMISAWDCGAPLTVRLLAALGSNMKQGQNAKTRVFLGVPEPPATSPFPKQEVLFQSVRGDYPTLSSVCLPPEAVDCSAEVDAFRMMYFDAALRADNRWLTTVLTQFCGGTKPYVSSFAFLDDCGVLGCMVHASEAPANPAVAALSDVVWVARTHMSRLNNPVMWLKKGGYLVLATSMAPYDALDSLPPSWVGAMGDRGIHLAVFQGPVSEASAVLTALQSGQSHHNLTLISPQDIKQVPDRETDVNPPAFLAQIPVNTRFDNVPRFWGDFLQPRIQGEGEPAVPEACLSANLVPSSTAAFSDKSSDRAAVPRLDATLCTGCGQCWRLCPDSAIQALSLGLEDALNAAADLAKERVADLSDVASKLQRAHKNLANRLAGQLQKQKPKTLERALLMDCLDWLVGKMGLLEEEKPQYQRVFEATVDVLLSLPLAINDRFFFQPNDAQKGSGELLALHVNPHACQGCGLCAEVCPENAFEMNASAMKQANQWRSMTPVMDAMPDTKGQTIARLQAAEDFDPLAALMLSRHANLALCGGDDSAPGSAARIALRHVAGVLEPLSQTHLNARAQSLADLSQKLRDKILDLWSKSLPIDDLPALESGLAKLPATRSALADVIARIEETGQTASVDAQKVRYYAQFAAEVEDYHALWTRGQNLMGRARYAVVVASEMLAASLIYPRNPFQVPVTVETGPSGLSSALGLASGVMENHAAEIQWQRMIENALQTTPQSAMHEASNHPISWADLTDEEKATCPPVLVVLDDDVLVRGDLALLKRLFRGRGPVKILLLDRHAQSERVDPLALAMSVPGVFTLSSSIAHAQHLGQGLIRALQFSGPAFIHLFAGDGMAKNGLANQALNQARLAVESRLHPLAVFDPAADGVFGTRLDLSGNPHMDQPWMLHEDGNPCTPADWARHDAQRSAHLSPPEDPSDLSGLIPLQQWLESSSEEQADARPYVSWDEQPMLLSSDLARLVRDRHLNYQTLMEIAGLSMPFAHRLRDQIESELRAEFDGEIQRIKAEHQAELQSIIAQQKQEMAGQLTDRLMQLSTLVGHQLAQDGQDRENA